MCHQRHSHTYNSCTLLHVFSGALFALSQRLLAKSRLSRRRCVLLHCASSCKTPLGVQTIFVLCSAPFARASVSIWNDFFVCERKRASRDDERKRLNYCAAAGVAISFLVALKAPFITIIADSSRWSIRGERKASARPSPSNEMAGRF